jgi:hypothetical protein
VVKVHPLQANLIAGMQTIARKSSAKHGEGRFIIENCDVAARLLAAVVGEVSDSADEYRPWSIVNRKQESVPPNKSAIPKRVLPKNLNWARRKPGARPIVRSPKVAAVMAQTTTMVSSQKKGAFMKFAKFTIRSKMIALAIGFWGRLG